MPTVIAIKPSDLLGAPNLAQDFSHWAYLGTDYKAMLQLKHGPLCNLVRLPMARRMQFAAAGLRQPYLELIDSLNRQESSLPWWAGQPASRNPYHNLYIPTFFLALAPELV